MALAEDRYVEILKEMRDLYNRKAADYGSDEDPLANLRAASDFGATPLQGVLIRMNDKMYRMKRFIQKGRLANESARDSLIDMAVYTILGVQLLEEQLEGQSHSADEPTG